MTDHTCFRPFLRLSQEGIDTREMGRALLKPSKVSVSLFIGDQVFVVVEIHRAKAGAALKKFSTEAARVINLGQGRGTYIFLCVLTENYLKAWDAALQETNA